MLRPGKRGNYIDYECTCGWIGGVSSRQAHKGITCPKCRTKLCGPACVVICPHCRRKAIKSDKRKIVYICACGKKVEA